MKKNIKIIKIENQFVYIIVIFLGNLRRRKYLRE